MGARSLRIRFDKIDGFIKTYNGINVYYLMFIILLDYGWFDTICDKIKYLISEKVVLQIALIKVLQKSELIHMILYLLKSIDFS